MNQRGRPALKKQIKQEIKAEEAGKFHRAACLRSLNAVGRTLLPFPDRMRCLLTYDEGVQLLSSTAVTVRYTFSMNSLFDPNVTGTGAQPVFFDQLSTLYNRYRVYGSAIDVKCLSYNSVSTASPNPAEVVLCPSAVAASGGSLSTQDWAAQPRAIRKFCTTNIPLPTLRAAHSISEVLGVKDVEGADRLQALVSASPSEGAFWNIVANSVTSATADLQVHVKIVYDVEFYDRQVPALSLMQRQWRRLEPPPQAEAKGSPELDPRQDTSWNMVPKSLNEQGMADAPKGASSLANTPRPVRPGEMGNLFRAITNPSLKGK